MLTCCVCVLVNVLHDAPGNLQNRSNGITGTQGTSDASKDKYIMKRSQRKLYL